MRKDLKERLAKIHEDQAKEQAARDEKAANPVVGEEQSYPDIALSVYKNGQTNRWEVVEIEFDGANEKVGKLKRTICGDRIEAIQTFKIKAVNMRIIQ